MLIAKVGSHLSHIKRDLNFFYSNSIACGGLRNTSRIISSKQWRKNLATLLAASITDFLKVRFFSYPATVLRPSKNDFFSIIPCSVAIYELSFSGFIEFAFWLSVEGRGLHVEGEGNMSRVLRVCPITLTEAFTGKTHAGSTPEFSFPEMFLPHERGSLFTKVAMFEIVFSM